MTKPKYNGIVADQVPVVEEKGARIKVIAGSYGDVEGAFKPEFVAINYLDVELEKGSSWSYSANSDFTQFLYIVEGSGSIGDDQLVEHSCELLSNGELLDVVAGEGGLRFVLLEGLPLREEIAWGGPIVMNTRDELNLAFKELDEGTFIK